MTRFSFKFAKLDKIYINSDLDVSVKYGVIFNKYMVNFSSM